MTYENSLWTASGYSAYQDVPSSDDAAWYPAVHGSVVGLSPVLSNMSQNSHTLHFFPELDAFPTGPKADHFPLPNETSQWNMPEGLALGNFLSPDVCSSLSQGLPSESAFPDLSLEFPAQQPLLCIPDGQTGESRRSFSEPNVSHGRRLLPRTAQASPMSRSHSSSQYRAIQPHSAAVATPIDSESIASTPAQGPKSHTGLLKSPVASVSRPPASSEVLYSQDHLSFSTIACAGNPVAPAVYLQSPEFEDYRFHGDFDQTNAQSTR
jgi:hypothetical protein